MGSSCLSRCAAHSHASFTVSQFQNDHGAIGSDQEGENISAVVELQNELDVCLPDVDSSSLVMLKLLSLPLAERFCNDL